MPPNVLLVDDDSDIARGIRLRLSGAGYACAIAVDGEASWESAIAEPPQLILLDLKMPILDGIGMLRELKRLAQTKVIPVIVISASPAERRTVLDAGARFFLSKPYNGSHLLQTIQFVLDESTALINPPMESQTYM